MFSPSWLTVFVGYIGPLVSGCYKCHQVDATCLTFASMQLRLLVSSYAFISSCSSCFNTLGFFITLNLTKVLLEELYARAFQLFVVYFSILMRFIVVLLLNDHVVSLSGGMEWLQVYNKDMLMSLVMSRSPGTPLVTVSNHMST